MMTLNRVPEKQIILKAVVVKLNPFHWGDLNAFSLIWLLYFNGEIILNSDSETVHVG